MIIIPEIETVLILVPRTATGSLRRAVAQRYPDSMMLYRHMEADGVPHGYDRWRKIGVVRHPFDRLWSLYKFMKGISGNHHDKAFTDAMHESVRLPFDQWVRENRTVFTGFHDHGDAGGFYPVHTVRYPMPENRKSQFVYLRPDLGTQIYHFNDISILANHLSIMMSPHSENATVSLLPPHLSTETQNYMHKVFKWDFEQFGF